MQSALGGDNNDNELKIKQGANQDNNCDLKNDLDKKGSTDNTFACANVAFNIVCLPDSVCIYLMRKYRRARYSDLKISGDRPFFYYPLGCISCS